MRHRLLACALALVTAAPAPGRAEDVPKVTCPQGPAGAAGGGFAQDATILKITCAQGPPAAASAREPDLAGLWDFYMDVGGVPSFGLLSIGRLDGRYGGTLTPVRTAPVVLRSLTVSDRNVRMIVGSLEGDVTFNGALSAAGDRMCGIVAYHGGKLYPMVAQRRPQRPA